MPPLIRFLLNRLLSIPISLIIVTAVLYAFVMLTPPKVRAEMYLGASIDPARFTPEQIQRAYDRAFEKYHLDAPFPVQYGLWLAKMLSGDWGWSPVLHGNVLEALLARTPITAELAFYSILLFMPFGLISGVIAGTRKNESADRRFRLAAFIATSLPPFILAWVLMTIFYVGLHWLAPERLSTATMVNIRSSDFHTFTGFLTLDGLLNRRPDITLEAFKHLAMPVITLSLLHWATLGRVTRAAMIEEMQKEYVVAGRARGLPPRRLVWRHAFRNILTPALTSTALSAASLFGGVFVTEIIFNFKGVSDLVMSSARGTPDAAMLMGFGVYSVVAVLALMFVLDVLMAVLDPRLRSGVLEA